MPKTSDFKTLWVDSDQQLEEQLAESLVEEVSRIQFVHSSQEALRRVSQESYASVIADQSLPDMTGVTLLSQVRELSPHSTRILTTRMQASTVIEDAVNEAQVFSILAQPFDFEQVRECLRESERQYEKTLAKSSLVKEISLQNKKLEELTTGLEELVDERTKHIEQSKNMVERNLAEMRKLVLFIKELASLTALDELLPLLRKETKKFHHVQKPVLCYPSFDGKLKMLFFRSQDVLEKEVSVGWSPSVRLRVNQKEDREYLAELFSRPFAKVIAVPLSRSGIDRGQGELPAVVFIEHDLAEDKVEYFLEFVSRRLQPMSIAVDRVLLEYQAKFVSYQWESTFDGVATPIAIIDNEKKLLRSNRSFGDGVRGDSCHEILADRETVCTGCPVNRAVETLQEQSSRIHARGRIYDVYSYPIHLQGDMQATNVIHHYIDMTESRKLYSRVVQTEKLAAIGSLAGNIAHELNNPLTGIKSLTEVLLVEMDGKKEKNQQVIDDLKEVGRAAARSQVIIKNLLDFSNPEENGELSQVSLNEVIERTLPLLKTALHSHRSEIDLTDEENQVLVNAPLVQQVFFNLVTNACQAMQGPGTLQVRTRIDSRDQKFWVCLEVADSGPGIPKDVIQHIFEPFFTTKAEGKGTGLGLSMSRSIIDRYGGEISVSSEPGQGTTFHVHLPRRESEEK